MVFRIFFLVICKNKKRPGFYTLTETKCFTFLLITEDLNKNKKKNPEHLFVDTVKYVTCAKYQQKILNSMVVGACQKFELFKQIT